MNIKGVNILFVILGLVSLIFTSCREENLKPGVPAFVHVESFNFTSNYATQGTARQNIKDVWAFADGATIGVFELPADIPVLKDGAGQLRLEAGIELNGISTTRVNNPFFEPVIIDDFNFIPDSVKSVNPVTTYRTSTTFAWMEDFEEPTISLDTTNLSGNTGISTVSGDEAFQGNFSGYITLDSTHNVFEAATFNSFQLPKDGSPVLLEMNYKNDFYFTVGVIEESTSQIIKTEILVLYPSEEWNKIYVNFTDKVRASSAYQFKVFVRTYVDNNDTAAHIFLDNMKLMYR